VDVGRHSKFVVRACVGVAAACALGLVTLGNSVSAVGPGTLEDFESDVEGSYPADWAVYQERVILGSTILGDCTSVDNADYSDLPDITTQGVLYPPQGYWDPGFGTVDTDVMHSYGYPAWQAPGTSSQYQFSGTVPVWWNPGYGIHEAGPADEYPDDSWSWPFSWREELIELQAVEFNDRLPIKAEDNYDVTVLDGTGYGIGAESQVLQLYLYTDSYGGHVVHGPAVVSADVIQVGPGDTTLSFEFAASADMDYYHVYGYLLKSDCTQIEVFDSVGERSDWRTVTKTIPAGDYRFVFVAGTYDYTWGELGGALLWIDNILCTDNCVIAECTVNCDTSVIGPGVDEIVLLPNEEGNGYDFNVGWLEEALNKTPDELPSTGSNLRALPISGALLALGMGLFTLRRRIA
jgi:LPXTG-motif cell wall-anchored protein